MNDNLKPTVRVVQSRWSKVRFILGRVWMNGFCLLFLPMLGGNIAGHLFRSGDFVQGGILSFILIAMTITLAVKDK